MMIDKTDCSLPSMRKHVFRNVDVMCNEDRLLSNVVLTVARFIRSIRRLNIRNFKAVN